MEVTEFMTLVDVTVQRLTPGANWKLSLQNGYITLSLVWGIALVDGNITLDEVRLAKSGVVQRFIELTAIELLERHEMLNRYRVGYTKEWRSPWEHE